MDNISKFIKNNRERAQSYAIETNEYLKENRVPPFKTRAELAAYLRANDLSVDPNKLERIWIGSQILEAISTIPTQEPEAPQETARGQGGFANFAGLLASPLFFIRRRPDLLEDDPKFKKIEENLAKEWQKNNPGKTSESHEWLDYRYGNLDNPDAPTLRSDAERQFREKNKSRAAYYDERAKKIYKTLDEDPAVNRAKSNIDEHIKARKALFEAGKLEENRDEIEKKIKSREWDRFAKQYPTKSSAYQASNNDIRRTVERESIQRSLRSFQESTGKEIKYVEKAKREAPKISVSEATKRLEAIKPAVPPHKLYIPLEKPIGTTPIRSAPGSRLGRGLVDRINKLPSLLSNVQTAGRIVEQTATQPLGFFAKLTPIGWAGIGLLVIFALALFIIIFNPGNFAPSLGLGGGGGGGQGTGPGDGGQQAAGLNYSIPFRDPNVIPQDIRGQITANWPDAKIGNWDTIVSQAVANGWNPAFLLALWIEESGAQGVPAADPLGCAPGQQNDDINKSLACVFISFGFLSNDRFADFMCRYSDGHDAPCTFAQNPNFPPNIRFWYEKLVPAGSYGALIEVAPPSGPLFSATCPIPGATASTVSCGSEFTPRSECGHCGLNYPAPELCIYEDIHYAEDIPGPPGQNVYFPKIDGEILDWILLSEDRTNSGVGYIIEYRGTSPSSKLYWLRFHHVDQGSGTSEGKSGDVGAKICTNNPNCNHVHFEFASLGTGGRKPIDTAANFCL